MKPPLLLIWDCDGVLVDSEVINNRIEAEVKTELGFPTTMEEQIRKFVGLSELHPLVQAEIQRLPSNYLEEVDRRIEEAYPRELRAIVGIKEVLAKINTAHCVASSSHPDWLKLKLKLTGLAPNFGEAVYSAHQVKRGKPAPDLFILAAGKMGFSPDDCLVIEDSIPGVKAGKAAGMRVCGFLGGGHTYPAHASDLRDAGADFIISDISQLAGIFQ